VKVIWPFRHLGLKLLALALAILLWLVVAGEEVVERGLRVPLELQQFPVGLELRGEWPTFVDVRLRGPSGALGRLSAGDIVAVLDLRSAKVGPRLFQLTADQVRTPFGIQAVQVTPPSVGLTFERSKTKVVPVRPPVEGDPEPGYVVGEVTVAPPTVEVVGPESLVDQVSEAVTEPVSIAGARDHVSEEVIVGFVDAALRLKVPRPALVTVQVVPGPDERTITERSIHFRNIGTNLTALATPAVTTVTLRGSRQSLNRVDIAAITPYVDLSGLAAGEHVLNVHVDDAHDVGVARVEPDTVRIHITSAKP
jgi:YbbR domain-containing protein